MTTPKTAQEEREAILSLIEVATDALTGLGDCEPAILTLNAIKSAIQRGDHNQLHKEQS